MPSFEGAHAVHGEAVPASVPDDALSAFPPITRDQILNCSYDSWFPNYRPYALKSRIIKLSPAFVEYIGQDGIILADDDEAGTEGRGEEDEEWAPSTFTKRPQDLADEESDSDSEPEPDSRPPNERFPEIHKEIQDRIRELGGAVVPKLNWSSPKDAAWISPHQNTLKCTSPNDIYLLLKSSSFVSHDLEHAFDGTTETPSSASRPFQPVLVLRPFFSPHPALEFRCFVKQRSLIGMCSRDQNYYPFLDELRPAISGKIEDFFEDRLRYTFPDGSFVFDVYIPEDGDAVDGLGKVRLIDINPWAPRTDSLLFDWGELLEFRVPRPIIGTVVNREIPEAGSADDTTDDEADEVVPELRLMEKDNPASSNFSSSQYSAHKLPKEVVDASTAGDGGLREFMQRWRELTERDGGSDVWESGRPQ
ncbi:D123-domain-containing protein [Plectosphaerella cucumerina]|uniref:D123-domain-containing protein n=1 Tax=Plectosphaerella cucumerina TaxID=40658 RepID=A0A8K0T912_9PEZI|nr:D123-domain-containing protein [Plectosphaerella cucumerina]